MTIEIPQYGLRAYALLFSKFGVREAFKQSELDWIVSSSMKKKIFALLLRCGWIEKKDRETYTCVAPAQAIQGLLEFRVPQIIRCAQKPYAFTQLSAVEIWSDFSYVQRGREKSPYFINVIQKDLQYWKDFFHTQEIPNYVHSGTTIGEYIILIPVRKIVAEEKEGLFVESLQKTMKYAAGNDIFAYAFEYMKRKYYY